MTSAQVGQFLNRLNDAWLTQDYVGLSSLYHPDVVLLPPDIGEPIEGIEAVCDAYRDFHAACTVQRFEMTRQTSWSSSSVTDQSPATDQIAATMVHMHFAIDYQLRISSASQSADLSEQGLEVYTLVPGQDSQPRIVWRAQFAL